MKLENMDQDSFQIVPSPSDSWVQGPSRDSLVGRLIVILCSRNDRALVSRNPDFTSEIMKTEKVKN